MKKSNVRHLTTALTAAACLAGSPSSFALGIGEMHLQSSLNQNLQAEISLILSEGEKGSDFQIGFASNTKFDEAGIPWSLFLSKIKFKTVTENGKTVIKLNSTEVLKEPFLDFLLEVKSSKGTLYREFTVLVDPPNAYQSFTSLSEEPTPKSSELPLRFVSAPTPVVVKPKPKVHHAVAIKKHAHKNKSPKIAVTTNPLASNTVNTPAPVAKKEINVEKLPNNTSPVKIDSGVVEPVAIQQKVVELEKQVSAMQKTIAEKDAQMNALKTPAPIAVPAITAKNPPTPAIQSVNLPPPMLPTPVVITPPTIAAPLTMPEETPAQAVAVLPPPVASTIPQSIKTTPTPTATSTPAATTIFTPENYFGIPTDMYYYVAGGAGSLLLGLLGWLQRRAKNKQQATSPEIVPEVDKIETVENVNDEQKTTDNLDAMFGDDLDMNAADFENLSASDFGSFTKNDSDKHTTDDVLYKASVYCSYGNHELAVTLLHDEFIKNPNAHDYALHLLTLYVTENHKEEFKDFVFELAKLGKNDLPEFWTQVSDIAAKFYPEALIFTHSSTVSDPFSAMFTDDSDSIGFDAMNFTDADDKEITFGELSEEKISSDDALEMEAFMFEMPTKKEPVFDSNSSGFTMDESLETEEALAFEIPPEKEAEMELDFSGFGLGKTAEPEALAFEMPAEKEVETELDFSGFGFGETTEPKALAFEMPAEKEEETELDFSGFGFGETSESEALAFEMPAEKEAEMELDFSGFGFGETTEPEALAFEMPAEKEAEMELDFSGFGFGETTEPEALAFEMPAEKELETELDFSGFGLGKTTEPEALAFEMPAEKEAEMELDFSGFGFGETSEPEALAFEMPAEKEVETELDFSGFGFGETAEPEALAFEIPAEKETKMELDFSGFGFGETAEPEVLAFEMPAEKEAEIELDFSGFGFGETTEPEALAFEMPAEKEDEMELDFSGFASAIGESLETKKMTFETPVEKEPKMELDFSAFSMDKPLEPEILAFEMPAAKKEPEVLEFKKSEPLKSSLNFEKVSHLVEEKVSQTYFDLAKIHKAEEETHLNYLDMSDSEFAESLAAEVLEKCKIKEQLCRQRIAQEVLSKLC
jgi:pilus assembly protein FimV